MSSVLRCCFVQSLSCVQLFVIPWIAAHQASQFSNISRNLLKLMPIELVMPSNNLFLCRPLLLVPSVFPSIRVFSNESALWIRCPNVSASVLPMNIQDWFSLGLTYLITLLSKGLSRVFSNTAAQKIVLWRLAFFMVQHSHQYMTTRKTIALAIWTSVSKAMSLLFNMLSTFVIAFLQRSKHLLILWLQSPSTVILEHNIIKSLSVSIVSTSTCNEVMGLDAMMLVF